METQKAFKYNIESQLTKICGITIFNYNIIKITKKFQSKNKIILNYIKNKKYKYAR